jgi:hypothetical protein
MRVQIHVLDMGYTAEVGPEVALFRAPLPQEPFLPVPCTLVHTQHQLSLQFEPYAEVNLDVVGKAVSFLFTSA